MVVLGEQLAETVHCVNLLVPARLGGGGGGGGGSGGLHPKPGEPLAAEPTANAAALESIVITLAQGAKPPLSFSLASRGYLSYLLPDVRRGETLTFSYWSDHDMRWLDSGVCAADTQDRCGERVSFRDLAIRSLPRPKAVALAAAGTSATLSMSAALGLALPPSSPPTSTRSPTRHCAAWCSAEFGITHCFNEGCQTCVFCDRWKPHSPPPVLPLPPSAATPCSPSPLAHYPPTIAHRSPAEYEEAATILAPPPTLAPAAAPRSHGPQSHSSGSDSAAPGATQRAADGPAGESFLELPLVDGVGDVRRPLAQEQRAAPLDVLLSNPLLLSALAIVLLIGAGLSSRWRACARTVRSQSARRARIQQSARRGELCSSDGAVRMARVASEEPWFEGGEGEGEGEEDKGEGEGEGEGEASLPGRLPACGLHGEHTADREMLLNDETEI